MFYVSTFDRRRPAYGVWVASGGDRSLTSSLTKSSWHRKIPENLGSVNRVCGAELGGSRRPGSRIPRTASPTGTATF
jgi:hypothetical protein